MTEIITGFFNLELTGGQDAKNLSGSYRAAPIS
jgi:hypothetical protein